MRVGWYRHCWLAQSFSMSIEKNKIKERISISTWYSTWYSDSIRPKYIPRINETQLAHQNGSAPVVDEHAPRLIRAEVMGGLLDINSVTFLILLYWPISQPFVSNYWQYSLFLFIHYGGEFRTTVLVHVCRATKSLHGELRTKFWCEFPLVRHARILVGSSSAWCSGRWMFQTAGRAICSLGVTSTSVPCTE